MKFKHFQLSFQISTECTELLKITKPPHECCQYPRLEANDEIVRKCIAECSSEKRDTNNCCYRSCLFTVSGIFENEKFNEKNCENFFVFEVDNENWKKTVKESLKNCQKEGELGVLY